MCLRVLSLLVVLSLLSTVPVFADPDPEGAILETVFDPFDRVEQGAPDCDEPLAERPCVDWSYYRFQGVPYDWSFESTRSHDGATVYMGLSTVPDPRLTSTSGRPLTVHAVDAETGDERWVTKIDPYMRPIPTDMELSDDGDLIAFSGYLQENSTCAAYAVDAASGAELWSYTAPGHYNCRGIDITPDGSKVYLVGNTVDAESRSISFYHTLDATDGSRIGGAAGEFYYEAHHDILALDNGSAYVTGQLSAGPGEIFVFLAHFVDDVFAWEARIPATEWQTWDGRQPLLSPDGSTIYFGDFQNTGAVDATTGAVLWTAPSPAIDLHHLPDLVLSPDGSRLVVLDSERLRILDPLTGATDWTLPHEGTRLPRDAVFTEDSSELVVLFDREEFVASYDAATGMRLRSIEVDGGTPSRVFLTHEGFLVSTVNPGLFSQGVHLASYWV